MSDCVFHSPILELDESEDLSYSSNHSRSSIIEEEHKGQLIRDLKEEYRGGEQIFKSPKNQWIDSKIQSKWP